MDDVLNFPFSRLARAPVASSEHGRTNFATSDLLAEVLDQALPQLKLGARAQANRSLTDRIAALPTSQREELSAQLGPSTLDELLSLEKEKNAEVFFASLFNLAGRLSGNEVTLATSWILYRLIERFPNRTGLASAASVRRQALEGWGGFGKRAELYLKKLGREAGDYRSLIAIFAGSMAGSMLYNVSRFKIGRILGRALEARAQSVGFLHPIEIVKLRFQTRGLALLTGSVGSTLMERGLGEMSGQKISWEASRLLEDSAMSLLNLLAWRSSVAFSDMYRFRAIAGPQTAHSLLKEVETFAFSQMLAVTSMGVAMVGHEKLFNRGPENGIAAGFNVMSLLLGMNVGRGLGRRAVFAFK